MTLLWIYNLPLKPESGGTERITSLVAKDSLCVVIIAWISWSSMSIPE